MGDSGKYYCILISDDEEVYIYGWNLRVIPQEI